MNPAPIAGWNNFFVAETSAAAALAGLVFVAVSINLPRILSLPGVPGRAAESICQLFAAMVASMMVLIPGQPESVIGWELVGIGAVIWIVQTILQVLQWRLRLDQPRWWIGWRIVLSQFATVPFCIAGVSLLTGLPGGLYWMAPACILSLWLGVASAWILLIEIMR